MSKMITPKSIEDLERIMKKGYLHDSGSIQSFLNISKTQFYEHIYKDVSKLKINKKYREELKKRNVYAAEDSSDYIYSLAVTHIIMADINVVFNLEEILHHLNNNELVSYELYDKENNKYIKLNKKEIEESFWLLYEALVNAKKSSELKELIIDDTADNYKTMQSRFHSRIKEKYHFRIIVCGRYVYSIIDSIQDERNIIFEIYEESMKMLSRVRGD